MCVSTPKCSAFHFDDQHKACELGSEMKLVPSQSLSNQDVAVQYYGEGQTRSNPIKNINLVLEMTTLVSSLKIIYLKKKSFT
jgi:hypothetical protein